MEQVKCVQCEAPIITVEFTQEGAPVCRTCVEEEGAKYDEKTDVSILFGNE